jgi:hypothetical protein
MLVLSALVVPCGLLVLMMAMQRVQERLLPSAGPEVPAADPFVAHASADHEAAVAVPAPVAGPVFVIPAPSRYESSDSVVGSASLTSASPSR